MSTLYHINIRSLLSKALMSPAESLSLLVLFNGKWACFFLQFEFNSTNVPLSLEFQLFISYLVIKIQIFVNMKKILKNGQKWTKIDVFWPIRWFGRLDRSFGRSSSAENHRSFGRSFGFGRTLETSYYCSQIFLIKPLQIKKF